VRLRQVPPPLSGPASLSLPRAGGWCHHRDDGDGHYDELPPAWARGVLLPRPSLQPSPSSPTPKALKGEPLSAMKLLPGRVPPPPCRRPCSRLALDAPSHTPPPILWPIGKEGCPTDLHHLGWPPRLTHPNPDPPLSSQGVPPTPSAAPDSSTSHQLSATQLSPPSALKVPSQGSAGQRTLEKERTFSPNRPMRPPAAAGTGDGGGIGGACMDRESCNGCTLA
jgi:hypothetical protein